MSGLTIGQLSRRAKVAVDTIRYYEKYGLLHPQRRPSGFREYMPEDLERLLFIRHARAFGFSLDEIEQLLRVDSEPNATTVGPAVRDHLEVIEEKIAALRGWRAALLAWRAQALGTEQSQSLVSAMSNYSPHSRTGCTPGCGCPEST
jgi:MerR family copper efflux transcriptional regulator